jgi:hypothetical protein
VNGHSWENPGNPPRVGCRVNPRNFHVLIYDYIITHLGISPILGGLVFRQAQPPSCHNFAATQEKLLVENWCDENVPSNMEREAGS